MCGLVRGGVSLGVRLEVSKDSSHSQFLVYFVVAAIVLFLGFFIYLFLKNLSFLFSFSACLLICRMGSLEAQVGLELTIVGEDDLDLLTLPPLPCQYWDYRHVPPYPTDETPCSFHCSNNLGSSLSDPILQMRKAGFEWESGSEFNAFYPNLPVIWNDILKACGGVTLCKASETCIHARRCLRGLNMIFCDILFQCWLSDLVGLLFGQKPKSLTRWTSRDKKHTDPSGSASWVSSYHFLALPMNPWEWLWLQDDTPCSAWTSAMYRKPARKMAMYPSTLYVEHISPDVDQSWCLLAYISRSTPNFKFCPCLGVIVHIACYAPPPSDHLLLWARNSDRFLSMQTLQ